MFQNHPLFILAGNGSYCNRGCEAILRGTVFILRQHFNQPHFLAVSSYKNEEQYNEQRKNEKDSAIVHKTMYNRYRKFSFPWCLSKTLWFLYPNALRHIIYKDLKPSLHEAQAVLALGGDNYSLALSGLKRLPITCLQLDELVISQGKPLVIWGASVGPFDKFPAGERYMTKHLRKVHILARETVTIEYLEKIGLTENVHQVADPAFLMRPIKPPSEEYQEIEPGNIGLNLSPLMKDYATKGDLSQWQNLAAAIIHNILEKTKRRIYLIPHVTGMPWNDDYLFMQKVISLMPELKKKVVLVPPVFNAAETKWIIGQMEMFVGARMHSTIASYSMRIPTINLAYSIKAEGLSKDIYNHNDYCIMPQDLKPDRVADKVAEILREAKYHRRYLSQRISKMEDMSLQAGEILQGILRNSSC